MGEVREALQPASAEEIIAALQEDKQIGINFLENNLQNGLVDAKDAKAIQEALKKAVAGDQRPDQRVLKMLNHLEKMQRDVEAKERRQQFSVVEGGRATATETKPTRETTEIKNVIDKLDGLIDTFDSRGDKSATMIKVQKLLEQLNSFSKPDLKRVLANSKNLEILDNLQTALVKLSIDDVPGSKDLSQIVEDLKKSTLR